MPDEAEEAIAKAIYDAMRYESGLVLGCKPAWGANTPLEREARRLARAVVVVLRTKGGSDDGQDG